MPYSAENVRREDIEFLDHVGLRLRTEGEAAEFPVVGVGEVEFDVGVFRGGRRWR